LRPVRAAEDLDHQEERRKIKPKNIQTLNIEYKEAAMDTSVWLNGVDVAVTVCDREGIIVYMNEQAARTFSADGGKALLGKNLRACHPEAANEKIRGLMAEGKSNSYTIEKNGVKKLIHQVPWHVNNELAGLVEFSLVIPWDMPHSVRS
jgi:transcriptional regulator with PAS, ATPase and Fis domain